MPIIPIIIHKPDPLTVGIQRFISRLGRRPFIDFPVVGEIDCKVCSLHAHLAVTAGASSLLRFGEWQCEDELFDKYQSRPMPALFKLPFRTLQKRCDRLPNLSCLLRFFEPDHDLQFLSL